MERTRDFLLCMGTIGLIAILFYLAFGDHMRPANPPWPAQQIVHLKP
jgi:hypothetical protein